MCTMVRQATTFSLVRRCQKTRLAKRGSFSESDPPSPILRYQGESRTRDRVSHFDVSLSVGALVDSGADDCFIDHEFVTQAGFPTVSLPKPLSMTALNGSYLGKITHQTVPVTLTVSGNHSETIQFKVLISSAAPVVLGKP